MVEVTVDQLTRIEGHYRITTQVNEEGIVTEAQSIGLMLRGFERFLQNQDPRDAALLTQRICGVCPTTHSIAAANALDQLFGVTDAVPKDALVMRNIHQSLNLLASHATHFYVLWGPDLANPAYRTLLGNYGDAGKAVWDELLGRFAPVSYRLDGVDVPVGSGYVAALGEKRRLHEAISLFGAKMPHSVVAHVGGVTYGPTAADIGQLASYYWKFMDFVEDIALGVSPETWVENTRFASSPQKAVGFVVDRLQELVDASLVSNDFSYAAGWGDVPLYAAFGSELIGEEVLGLPVSMKLDRIGGYSDPSKIGFLAYGLFFKPELGDGYDPASPPESRVIPSGFLNGNLELQKFDHRKISESIAHSFYVDTESDRYPMEGTTQPEPEPDEIDYSRGVESRYSWVKAPHYGGIPCEVGPLSRMLVMKDPLITGFADLFREKGYPVTNTYLRMLARLQEILVVASELIKWLAEDLNPNGKFAVPTDLSMAKDSEGMGLWEAPRGALGHWIKTGPDSKVTLYQAVVPSTWNMAPRNSAGIPGPVEQVLLGSKISVAENALGVDYTNPLGILHTARSYDPCLACAIHAIDLKGQQKGQFRVV
ncbi:F420-nonreducing hydrogenase [Methanosarcina sp. 2.H.T.1A.6]|uniref:nickel-dependent hydrogenase large subunit n=1 Tax=unclassified Methanosarcina TaxID=2644672 RepID=UPI000621A0F2|nr:MULTISPECIES: nickel-dependent hydrogenase large subunit [unclassified Methanosarcina]KKG18568.1 F420-nonreducing hydrogenase [Methanosarcina sp. 2.H.T.1A.3]KKG20968.1 F420-nonreducing hydrogenase [Methanosarcina sp. 2.H.T.1A.6]KKG22963.1 F420-nonreducing hydrogenase [Methanosarcina sp. 2.H.T.1A.8]KKG28236.1 F420-nonreducing hydrogenase [Methanosarcina sp. 2.H.T.1A.15]